MLVGNQNTVAASSNVPGTQMNVTGQLGLFIEITLLSLDVSVLLTSMVPSPD